MVDAGETFAPGVGSDIAKPGTAELAYPGTPLEAALSLFDGVDEVASGLANISCPVLMFTSRQDHVVPPSSSELLRESVSGPVEQVLLGAQLPRRDPRLRRRRGDRAHRRVRAHDRRGGATRAGDMTGPTSAGHRLTREDAAYVARLARIDLSPEELDMFAVQLAAVLDHAAQVAAIDTSNVEPTAHPLPLVNVLRADEPRALVSTATRSSRRPRRASRAASRSRECWVKLHERTDRPGICCRARRMRYASGSALRVGCARAFARTDRGPRRRAPRFRDGRCRRRSGAGREGRHARSTADGSRSARRSSGAR